MKKFILSAAAFALVAVSGITLAPTTASAIPAFARQTGAACLSCHFQTFPAIKAFGRAFKMGSFTDVGDQALVEDDNLSIPAVLNATFVVRGNYTSTSKTGVASDGTYTIPADAVLMIAGRIGSNSGAFIEFDGGAANWQLLNSFDVGGFKAGIGAHKSGFGGSGVMEISNVFGQHGGKLAGKDISGIQAAGFAAGTTGIGAWIGNDLGILQFSLVAPATATAGTVNVGTSLGKLVRGIATLDVGGWDTLIGFGIVTGTAGKGTAIGATASVPAVAAGGLSVRQPMNLQFIDVQLQGDVGDMSVGIYGDWAHANGKTSSAGAGNFYGGGVLDGQKFDAWSVRAEVKPLHNVILGIGYGYDKTTQVAGSANAEVTNKKLQLAATYEIYQNFELNFVYNSTKNNAGTVAVPTSATTRTTLLEFEALM